MMKKLSELSGTFVTHRRRDHCRGCLRDIDIYQRDTNNSQVLPKLQPEPSLRT